MELKTPANDHFPAMAVLRLPTPHQLIPIGPSRSQSRKIVVLLRQRVKP